MTTTLSIRIDQDLKADAEEFFEEIGMNMTTGVTCFLKKCLATGEIPFKFSLKKLTPREETLAAFEEAKRLANDPSTPRCTNPDKLEEFLFS